MATAEEVEVEVKNLDGETSIAIKKFPKRSRKLTDINCRLRLLKSLGRL